MSVSVVPVASELVWRADESRPSHGFRTDFRLALLTLGRLSLVPVIMLSFMRNPFIATSALVVFVIADIFDGVFARNFEADGPRRRALDSFVDRVAIDVCMISAYVVGALPVLLLVALLTRDAYCAVICIRMVYRRNVAIKADWVYRALNLSVAAGAVAAPFLSRSLWVSMAGVLVVVSIIVAIDLTRAVRLVEKSPAHVRDMVLAAGALRRRNVC